MATGGTESFDRDHLADRVADWRQLARVERYRLEDGDRRVRLTTAGGFDVEVLPDRGLDLGAVSWQGVPIAACLPPLWSPPLPDGSAESFARRFGAGLLTTCGLDSYGSPSTDLGQDLPQHGRATDLPATDVTTDAGWRDGRYRVAVSGRMRQWRMFGEDLAWSRTVETALGDDRLVVRDTITNQGRQPWPHMVLHHVNFGHPLLDTDTRIAVARSGAPVDPEPRDDDARAGLASWSSFPAPRAGFAEQVFRHDLTPSDPGIVTVTNDRLGLAVSVHVDPSRMPHVFQWTMAGAGTYALGIEPGTTPTMAGRARARDLGVLDDLEPGETRRHDLEITVARTS